MRKLSADDRGCVGAELERTWVLPFKLLLSAEALQQLSSCSAAADAGSWHYSTC